MPDEEAEEVEGGGSPPPEFIPRRPDPPGETDFESAIKWERGETKMPIIRYLIICQKSILHCLLVHRYLWHLKLLYLFFWKHLNYRKAKEKHTAAVENGNIHSHIHLAFFYFHRVGLTRWEQYRNPQFSCEKEGISHLVEATRKYGNNIWRGDPKEKEELEELKAFYETNFGHNFSCEQLYDETRAMFRDDRVYLEDILFMGCVLMEPRNPYYNQHLATTLFRVVHEEGEIEGTFIEGTFWYGRALLNGLGVKVDRDLGLEYIEKAASHGLRRALFELGMVYEHGYGDKESCKGKKNLPFALAYYEAVATRPKPRYHEMIDDFEQIQPLRNPDWQEVDQAVGQNIFSMMAWELAGQAFLFAAAATLSAAGPEVQHYALLYFFLPIIGIFVSVSSIITTREVMHQNGEKGNSLLLKIWVAKKKACEALVGGSFYGSSNLEKASNLSWLSGWCCLWLNVLFLSTWITLLVTESIWWASAGETSIIPAGNDVRDAIDRFRW